MVSNIAVRHECLESLVLGPDFSREISRVAIRMVGLSCRGLRRLRLSGLRLIDSYAINALSENCANLIDLGFMDCLSLDGTAIANITSLKYLSVSGTLGLNWDVVSNLWSKLPNLVGLDVSSTNIDPTTVSRLLRSSQSLRVLCAMKCSVVEEDETFVMKYGNEGCFSRGKLLVSMFSDVFIGVGNLFADNSMRGENVFLYWRGSENKDKMLEEIMSWIEWTLSYSMWQIVKIKHPPLDNFWVSQVGTLLLTLMQSTQEDVQEIAATRLATFVGINDENASIDTERAEVVLCGGGVKLLLKLARSWREGLQLDSAKAIASLSVNANVAKALANEEGFTILANLARSTNMLIAEEAARGLFNLSVAEEHRNVIADAGVGKVLVDLIIKWFSGGDKVLEHAAGALVKLAEDDKCSMEVANAGGIHVLVRLLRFRKFEEVQEQAARALASLASYGDSNTNNSDIGREPGALDALVQLTRSPREGVRKEAAHALSNLSCDDRNRGAIAVAGGVEALVALAKSCANASPGLQKRAAEALWELSTSESNSIAIGREGGVAPLIALAKSEAEDVHEPAAGALLNIAFNPGDALRIVEEGGAPALVRICSTSVSKKARFMAALALAYMFDGRVDEVGMVGTSSESVSESISLDGARRMALEQIEAFVLTFSDRQAFAAAAAASSAPAALAKVTEAARIQEVGHLSCSGAEIGRFVAMLSNPSSILKAFAAFVLLQFTIPGGRHAPHNAQLLQNAGAAEVLHAAAEAGIAPVQASNIFARIVLRNLEHHMLDIST